MKVPPENKCAWCDKFIEEDAEIRAIGARFPEKVDMNAFEGNIIFLGFEGVKKKVPAIVVQSDSEIKESGSDLAFMTCGQSCFDDLKNILDKEKDLLGVKGL